MSSNFGQFGRLTTELTAIERLKRFPIDLQWENSVSMLARSFLIESSSKLLVTRTGIKTSDEFDFGPDQTTNFGVTCP